MSVEFYANSLTFRLGLINIVRCLCIVEIFDIHLTHLQVPLAQVIPDSPLL